MSEREFCALIAGAMIAGCVVAFAFMMIAERRWNRQWSDSTKAIVHDELLRNIVKQTRAMQEIASELRVIAEVVMNLDTIVGKEERQ